MNQIPRSFIILGFKVTPVTIDELLGLISHSVSTNSTCIIASQNLHGVYTYFVDETFWELHNRKDTCVCIDGMPIIWLARLSGIPLRIEQRVAWIDLFMPLLERAARDSWRIYYLGASEEVLNQGLDFVRKTYPGLQIAGHHGYFDAEPGSRQNHAIVQEINALAPHVLIVGMGMGRQERWILQNIKNLDANCVATCGALIEYFAGAAPTPPRWTGRFGLEWAHRLIMNPRRFAWRYLIEPWLTVGLILFHRFGRGGRFRR